MASGTRSGKNVTMENINSEVLMSLSKEKLVEMFLSLKDECVALRWLL